MMNLHIVPDELHYITTEVLLIILNEGATEWAVEFVELLESHLFVMADATATKGVVARGGDGGATIFDADCAELHSYQ